MPAVTEWSCLVTIDDKIWRSEETTAAQESSQELSIPRISRGLPLLAVEMKRASLEGAALDRSGQANLQPCLTTSILGAVLFWSGGSAMKLERISSQRFSSQGPGVRGFDFLPTSLT